MFAANDKGIALIITLTAVALIITITLELNRQMRQSVTSAANTKNRLTLVHRVNAGIETAKAVLAKDKTETNNVSLQDNWADPEFLENRLESLPAGNGTLALEISDERSRIQLNALVDFPEGRSFNPAQQQLWQRFFLLLMSAADSGDVDAFAGAEDLSPDMIINPVKDWLDSGDDDAITGISGAEADYYLSLDPPYSIRNGPFRHVKELMRVKNITADMFYGFDIPDYVTVYAMMPADGDPDAFTYDGKININTAPIPVIAALLPEGYGFLAEEIAAFREERANGGYINDLTDPTWYQSVPGAGDIAIDPELITTQSDHFRIVSTAEYEGLTLRATAIVLRRQDEETGRWYCKTLSREYGGI